MSDQNLAKWRKLALNLEGEINKVIVGQEKPIRLITNAIFFCSFGDKTMIGHSGYCIKF